MKIIDVIGGFINDNIKNDVFEKYVYENIESIEQEVSGDLYLEIISADYNSRAAVIHLKKILSDYYGDKLDKYNDAYFEREIDLDEDLRKVIDHEPTEENIVFDCGGITTQKQLQYEIKKFFHMPTWFGMNWDAIDDLIDLSHVKKIELNNFNDMLEIMHDDSLIFLSILKKHSEKSCEIIVK